MAKNLTVVSQAKWPKISQNGQDFKRKKLPLKAKTLFAVELNN